MRRWFLAIFKEGMMRKRQLFSLQTICRHVWRFGKSLMFRIRATTAFSPQSFRSVPTSPLPSPSSVLKVPTIGNTPVFWGPFLEGSEKSFLKLRPIISVKLIFSYVVKRNKNSGPCSQPQLPCCRLKGYANICRGKYGPFNAAEAYDTCCLTPAQVIRLSACFRWWPYHGAEWGWNNYTSAMFSYFYSKNLPIHPIVAENNDGERKNKANKN